VRLRFDRQGNHVDVFYGFKVIASISISTPGESTVVLYWEPNHTETTEPLPVSQVKEIIEYCEKEGIL
jgi:hypothetical protein